MSDSHKPTSYRASCGCVTLTVTHDPGAILPQQWALTALIDIDGAQWHYFNRTVGEEHAKEAAVVLARYACNKHGVDEPAGLDQPLWELNA